MQFLVALRRHFLPALVCAGSLTSCLCSAPLLAQGNDPAAAANTAPASVPGAGAAIDALRPALAQVNNALLGVNVGHWKAPGEVRNTSQEDIASIQRDLNGTLPPLLDQAAAAPRSIAPSFAVFRNIDALYDVLLRVTETASLAGSSGDAQRLEQARSALANARSQFGNALLQSATIQDAQLTRLRVPPPSAQPPAPPAHTVIDDGPAPTPTTHRRKKPAAKPPQP